MKQRISSLLGAVSACSLIIFLLLSSVDMNCFNTHFFEQQYEELHTATALGMSETDLMKATTTLLDYLRGEVDTIDVEVNINGVQRLAFNAKESAHMVDVRTLYQNAMTVRWSACILFVISIAVLLYLQRKAFFHYFSKGLLFVSCLFILFLCLLGIWIQADFTGFWTTFHHIFFTNNLWLLNPATDLMINLFPEAFFANLVIRIILWFLAFYLSFLIMAIYDQHQALQMYFFPQSITKKKGRLDK